MGAESCRGDCAHPKTRPTLELTCTRKIASLGPLSSRTNACHLLLLFVTAVPNISFRSSKATITSMMALIIIPPWLVCVYYCTVPITKLFTWGGETTEDMCYERKQWRTCATRDYEPRPVWTVCVCLLLQDLVQSCLRGEGRILEDMCYERRRAEACVD